MKEIRPGYWKGEIWHQGKRQAITFRGSAADAKLYEAEQRIEISNKGIIDQRTSPKFVDFCVDHYKPYAKNHVRQTTWNVRRYQLESVILFFGELKLKRITTQHVEQYKQLRQSQCIAKSTINSELNVLSGVLGYGRKLKLPCAEPEIDRYKVRRKKGRVKFWTLGEVQRIYDTCMRVAPRFFPLVFFLGQTGARKSEAIHLPWTNVDFERGIVRIWSEADEGDPDEDNYEVKSSDREVPMSDALAEVLKKQREDWPNSEWVFPVTQGKSKGLQYVCFPKNPFMRIIEKAGLTGGPHKFRHSYASLFLAKEPDLYLLSKLLGHSSYKVTEDIYAHLVPGYLDKARNVVGGVVPKPMTKPMLKVVAGGA
jgi:integrase